MAMTRSPRRLFVPLTLSAALLLAGCATTGLSLREGPGRDISAYVRAASAPSNGRPASRGIYAVGPGPGEPAAAVEARPIEKPASVAVAQVGEVAPPQALLEAMEARTDLFKSVQSVSGLFEPAPFGRGDASFGDLDGAREHLEVMLATARDIGASHLLVFGGTIDASERGGPLSILDLTIVGAFLVPSHKLDAEARGSAVLLDARTGRPVATASADETASTTSATVGLQGRQADQARDLRDALTLELAGKMIERFEALE